MYKQKKNEKIIVKVFSRINNLCDTLRGQVPLNVYIWKGDNKFEIKLYFETKKIYFKKSKKRKK